MAIYSTNILALPLILVLWMIDVWLFLVVIRPILSLLPYAGCRQWSDSLRCFSDPWAFRINTWIRKRLQKPFPAWIGYAFLLTLLMLGHHLLIWLIVSIGKI
jgi:hypothetical protein